MREHYEVVIIGAGIAGASLAYWLTELGITEIAIIERERRAGHHATGRSAATFVSFTPDPLEAALIVEAAAFLREPPAGFASGPLLDPTGVLMLFDEPDWAMAERGAAMLAGRGVPIEHLAPAAVAGRMPVPGATDVAGGLYFPGDGRVQVLRLLQAYLDHARRRGADLLLESELRELRIEGGVCTGVVTSAGTCSTRWVVDAAGAWAGHVARCAGALDIPFRPCRRTVITFAAPEALSAVLPAQGTPLQRWPMVCYESRGLYFAPEGDGFLASPMDEDLVEPGDVVASPAVIEQTRERLHALVPVLAPPMLRGSRAGLRTFAPDRRLVIGEDPVLRGFFWLAGQGGWGIESSPIVGRIAAELLSTGQSTWPDAELMSPRRFVR